jgi:FkbM family methyltransferase
MAGIHRKHFEYGKEGGKMDEPVVASVGARVLRCGGGVVLEMQQPASPVTTARQMERIAVMDPLGEDSDAEEGHAEFVQYWPEGGQFSGCDGWAEQAKRRAGSSVGATSEKEVRTVEKWGYKNQVWKVPTLAVTVRPNTTDDKVIAEVLTGNAYQNRTARFFIDAGDKWLDLGGNIATFALMALAAGGTVVSVEPEPENAALMRTNLAVNFETGWSVRECGVAVESGTMDLRLCNGTRNKYRHSMFVIQHWNAKHKVWKAPVKPRETVSVPVESLASMLEGINAVKMDIEGMEIGLLESLTDATCTGLRKLVFEYTWDVCPSVPRFLAIVKHLRQWFDVHYTGVNPDEPEYRHYPASTMVYCIVSVEELKG